jgi:pimeloyl-ACP methyl ester carboxylesterase
VEVFNSTDGTTIACEKTGSGAPLLLVHGTTADHRRWDGVAPRFAKHFTVYAMDRRGRGGSADGPDYDILHEAEDVAAVVDALGEPVRVVAHSYGAVCTVEASVLTDGIDRLVLYEPPIPTGVPMYPPGLPDRMQGLIDDGEPEAALELFFRDVVQMPDHEFVQYRSLPMWQSRIELAPTIPREVAIDRVYTFDPTKFTDIATPTLLLLGGDSPPMFHRAIELVHGALENSTVTMLPGQQHIAMDTAPNLFVDEVLGFLID